MNIILKIKTNGKVYWKTDSFWSLTKTREHAKIHSNDGIEGFLKNLISMVNTDITPERIKFYDNCKIGYDFVNKLSIVDFEFVKTGYYEYKLKYNKESDKFELVDIRRREKLKNIERKAK